MISKKGHTHTHVFRAVWFTMDERWARKEDEDDGDDDEEHEGSLHRELLPREE